MKRLLPSSFALLLLTIECLVGSSAWGDDRRDNQTMTRLFSSITQKVKPSVAQVLNDGRPVSLATVVASDGYLLTKRSELSGDPIRVRLSDNRIYPARVAAVRRQNDLALIRIDVDFSLTPIELSDYEPAIASFLVSAGRKGSPIGIGSMGAIPRRIDKQARLGVIVEEDQEGRPTISQVLPNSGAASAGVEAGDVIMAINGRVESSATGVVRTLKSMFPGERVNLRIRRSTELAGRETIELTALIRDLNVLRESANDARINGPRSNRLSGFESVIQHDTVLDPDQCGGPLLDSSGRVVGINIARAGRVVSYALPSKLVVRETVDMLREARASQ